MARLENPVIVSGFTQLERDLKATSPLMLKAMRTGLTLAMQPIKKDADALARSQISGMKRAKQKPPPWSEQRIGQTTKEVYMAPTEKGARARQSSSLRRPNFAALMLGRSYDPALESNRVQVLNTVDNVIGTVTRTF
jgi:hypothetical protein